MLQALRDTTGAWSIWRPSKIVCVAKNYPAHAAEMQGSVPAAPCFFLKPNSSLCDFAGPLNPPRDRGAVHHELELGVLIGRRMAGGQAPIEIAGVVLAIDLTLREEQSRLKQAGQPWEASKAFAGSCPVSPLLPAAAVPDPQAAELEFRVNGERRQFGNTAQMVFPIDRLLREAAEIFGLEAGDLLLTGTPAGVGPLAPGDTFEGRINAHRCSGQLVA